MAVGLFEVWPAYLSPEEFRVQVSQSKFYDLYVFALYRKPGQDTVCFLEDITLALSLDKKHVS